MINRKLILVLMIIAVAGAVLFNNHQRQVARHNLAEAVFAVSHVDIRKYKNGIDFTRPVEQVKIKSGEVFIQYQIPGASQGNFYARVGSSPSKLGINDMGYNHELQKKVKKELRYYVLIKDTDALSSYAAAVVDDWSTPEDESQTVGKDLQYFTTCILCFKLLSTYSSYSGGVGISK